MISGRFPDTALAPSTSPPPAATRPDGIGTGEVVPPAGAADQPDRLGIGQIGPDDQIAFADPAAARGLCSMMAGEVADIDDGQSAGERSHEPALSRSIR